MILISSLLFLLSKGLRGCLSYLSQPSPESNLRLCDVPRVPLDSNKTPEQPDNNTAVKAHASHRLIPRFFNALPSQTSWHLNHRWWEKMTFYEKNIDYLTFLITIRLYLSSKC
jgi:hypothetical protein